MKKTTIVLGIVAIFAVALANLAIQPTLLPAGYLAEGDTPPTDVNEVAEATERLKMGGVVPLLAMAILVKRAPPTVAVPLRLCACAVIALTVYQAWEVINIIIVWAGHIRGERAVEYFISVGLLAASVALVPALLIVL